MPVRKQINQSHTWRLEGRIRRMPKLNTRKGQSASWPVCKYNQYLRKKTTECTSQRRASKKDRNAFAKLFTGIPLS